MAERAAPPSPEEIAELRVFANRRLSHEELGSPPGAPEKR